MKKTITKGLLIVLICFTLFLSFACKEDDINLKTELEEIISVIPNQTENDITFLTQKDGFTLEWSSENETVITNDGKVYRQNEDITVRVKVTIKSDDEEYTKYIEILVPKTDEIISQGVTIKEVLSGTIGETYQTTGVVLEKNARSFILKDETGMILVYLGKEPNVSKGDLVAVNGTSASYGNTIQFGVDTLVEKIGTQEVTEPEAKDLMPSDVDAYGTLEMLTIEYVKVTGILTVSGYYYNVTINGASLEASISYPLNEEEVKAFDSKRVTVTGYVTGVTGKGSYLNILATEIIDEYNLPTISEVKQSEVGKTYKTQGKVYAVNAKSFLFGDETGKILVYLDSNPEVKVGDIVLVEGNTSIFGKAVQFGAGTSVTILSYNSVIYEEARVITANDLDVYAIKDSIEPEYVKLTGILTISGYYYNISVEGTNVKGSISYPKNIERLYALNEEMVTVTGYLTGISGNNQYANIISISVTEADDITTDNTFDLHILEVNDVHGYCLQDEYGKNGFSNIAYLVDEIRNKDARDDVILIANGDMFQGTAISNITYGKTIVDIMNEMQFDCMTIGNHEFDWKLETILKYFDGDKSNGEANFPLLNANIYNNDSTLVSLDNGNIFESTIIEKEGYKVGIIGYIGNVYTSISYVMRKDYYFDNNIKESVEKIGSNLKQNGCDFIIVAIHGGDSSSIQSYNYNKELAQLKYNGKYLVDAVINGHTHSRQEGYISRTGGVNMPVIQGGSNGLALGEIVLTINTDTREVIKTNTNIHNVYEADKNYDKNVEEIITKAKEENYDILNEVYTIAGENIYSRNTFYPWISSVLASGTGADISICNTGGVRSTGDINAGDRITIEQMYMINPFDNYIMYVKIKGRDILRFLGNGSIFYGFYNGLSVETIDENKEYGVAVIDYVYYWDNFPQNDNVINTGIIMRDLLIEDLKLRDSFAPSMTPSALVSNKLSE